MRLRVQFFFSFSEILEVNRCCVTRRVHTSPAEILSLHGDIIVTQLLRRSQTLHRGFKWLPTLVQMTRGLGLGLARTHPTCAHPHANLIPTDFVQCVNGDGKTRGAWQSVLQTC